MDIISGGTESVHLGSTSKSFLLPITAGDFYHQEFKTH